MKWTQSIIFLVGVVVMLQLATAASPRLSRQIFGEADPKRVPEMMTNRAFVESQGKCVVASDSEAGSLCDRIGRRLRANLPVAIQKGDCPSACTQDEKDAIVYVIKTLKAKYTDIWKSVVKHYKATPEQLEKLNAWITGTSSSSTSPSVASSESSLPLSQSSSVASSSSSASSNGITTTSPQLVDEEEEGGVA